MASPALTKIIAHRGARARYPENTLLAFKKAREAGAGWIECDVMLSADGVPVVIHDQTLDRTTNGQGRVDTMTARELQALDAGQGEPVPALAQVLDLCADIGLAINIEIKPSRPTAGPATAQVVVSRLAESRMRDPAGVLLSSFDPAALEVCQKEAPDLPRGLLIDSPCDDWRARAASLEVFSLHVAESYLDAAAIAGIRGTGLAVLAYTVNDTNRAAQLFDLGVAAVFTDEPEKLCRKSAE